MKEELVIVNVRQIHVEPNSDGTLTAWVETNGSNPEKNVKVQEKD